MNVVILKSDWYYLIVETMTQEVICAVETINEALVVCIQAGYTPVRIER